MRVVIDASVLDENEVETTARATIQFEAVGSEAWVRMKIGTQSWDIDYRDFWNAARAVGVDASPI